MLILVIVLYNKMKDIYVCTHPLCILNMCNNIAIHNSAMEISMKSLYASRN